MDLLENVHVISSALSIKKWRTYDQMIAHFQSRIGALSIKDWRTFNQEIAHFQSRNGSQK